MSQRLEAITEESDHASARNYREMALLGIAVCQAQASQPEAAIATLRRLLELAPETRAMIAYEPLFKPLAERKDFKQLIAR